MPSWCSVAACKSRVGGRDNKKCPGIIFVRFPRDPKICDRWVQQCQRTDDVKVKSGGICSLHFTEDHYDPTYIVKKAAMPNKYAKPKLKPGVIPSQNLTR